MELIRIPHMSRGDSRTVFFCDQDTLNRRWFLIRQLTAAKEWLSHGR